MLRLTEANSTLTCFQSHSSSSASSIGKPDPVPWPISAIGQRRITVPSALIMTQALTSPAPAASSPQYCALNAGAAAFAGDGMKKPSARPPARVVPVTIAWRRESCCCAAAWVMVSDLSRGAMNRSPYPDIGAAAADIGDGADIGVGRIGLLLQERHRRQNLAGLAIAALRHILGHPRRLHRMRRAAFAKPFYGGDLFALGGRYRQHAGADCLALDQHRAGTALGDAAAIFGTGQAKLVAERP